MLDINKVKDIEEEIVSDIEELSENADNLKSYSKEKETCEEETQFSVVEEHSFGHESVVEEGFDLDTNSDHNLYSDDFSNASESSSAENSVKSKKGLKD